MLTGEVVTNGLDAATAIAGEIVFAVRAGGGEHPLVGAEIGCASRKRASHSGK